MIRRPPRSTPPYTTLFRSRLVLHVGGLWLAFSCLSCGGQPPDIPDTPSADVVRQLLEAKFIESQNSGRTQTLAVDSLSCGDARLGEYRTDGVPANRDTSVVPCRVSYRIASTYSNFPSLNGVHKFEDEIVLFKTETGTLTFRIRSTQGFSCDANGNNCRKF